MDQGLWDEIRLKVDDKSTDIKLFMKSVEDFFALHPSLVADGRRVIHSTKSRFKDFDHLRLKLGRKIDKGRIIRPDNIFDEVTDLAGVRLLLLFQEDYSFVDRAIRKKVADGDWVLAERGHAFTWDPEASDFFGRFDLAVETRETSYTSVHFLVKPRMDSPLCCEVQVRTLFEEIWGEVDHLINYPNPTSILACKEQLMVLSKIVGAGSRLVDSISRTVNDAKPKP